VGVTLLLVFTQGTVLKALQAGKQHINQIVLEPKILVSNKGDDVQIAVRIVPARGTMETLTSPQPTILRFPAIIPSTPILSDPATGIKLIKRIGYANRNTHVGTHAHIKAYAGPGQPLEPGKGGSRLCRRLMAQQIKMPPRPQPTSS
jgi:hypothetical protein